MKAPFSREHARRDTRHHLLFEKPQWNLTDSSKRVRELGSYVIGVKRGAHDYLHQVIKPVEVPTKPVLDFMFEVGREYVGWQNDQDRLDRILDGLTGFAKSHRSPEVADSAWHIAASISGQLAVVSYFRDVQPRYE